MLTAIVPARKGSRRLKNKNIVSFGKSNLLLHKLEQLKLVNSIDQIVLSTDSNEMLEIGKKAGVNVHIRPIEYSDEKTKSFGEVVAFICSEVKGDHILWATCTSPLVSPELYEKAIKTYYKALNNGYDSLMSVEAFRRYVWNEDGPLNYQLGTKHVPSQNLPILYFVTDGILIAPKIKMIQWKYFHGSNPYKFVLDKRSSIDVDDKLDLACAKAWLEFE